MKEVTKEWGGWISVMYLVDNIEEYLCFEVAVLVT
jgi:hypothetical protein